MSSDGQPIRFSPFRYAALRVGVASLLALCFLWPSLDTSPLWPELAQGFHDLPPALRGGLRLAGLSAAAALCFGVLRRFAALASLLPLAFLVAHGRLPAGFAGAAACLAVAMAAYPGADPRLGALHEVAAASPRSLGIWFPALRATSLIVLPLVGFAAAAAPSLGNVALALFTTLLAALAAFDEKWLPPVGDQQAVVFFDGQCAFCNGAVRFILHEEQRANMTFAPLQGDTARATVSSDAGRPGGSIVFRSGGRDHVASEAALRIARAMGGFWRLLWILRLVPRPLRDAAYDGFAKNRYRWFGKLDSCPVPPREHRARFLP